MNGSANAEFNRAQRGRLDRRGGKHLTGRAGQADPPQYDLPDLRGKQNTHNKNTYKARAIGGEVAEDLFDFNPSPHSYKYYGVVELRELFERFGFNVKLYGYMDVRSVSMRQRILRPIKFLASKARIIPGSTQGKKWLKRIVFGGLVKMPGEITAETSQYIKPTGISSIAPDRMHKVIYCVARLS